MNPYLDNIIEGKIWNFSISALIIINTIVLGLETYPEIMLIYGDMLHLVDKAILWIFVCELIIRFLAQGISFFKKPWSLFDLFVIGISFVPNQEAFSALRAARALRALRLISIFPRLRGVIEGLVMAIPGIGAIGSVMAIIICVFALIASKLYGTDFPQWFGNFHLSIFSLFQIMTLEGWPDIVRTVMEQKPFAWVFFITYILIATFSVLNLFIAVIVDAMQRSHSAETQEDHDKILDIDKKLDLILEGLKKK